MTRHPLCRKCFLLALTFALCIAAWGGLAWWVWG